jgi:peptide/nickel transport system permease protein
MASLVARRLTQLVAVVLAVTFLAFAALNVLGDPLTNVVGPLAEIDCDAVEAGLIEDQSTTLNNTKTDCVIVAEARATYHLDEPLLERYFLWLGDVLTGDLGTSFQNDLPVSDVLREKIPETLMLLVMAQIVALGLAIPWGVAAAYRANGPLDRISTVGSFGLLSIPPFALGVILLYLFALRWQIFPTAFDDDTLWTRVKSLLLPAITLGLPLAASYQRLLRTDLITTLQEDFVHMARAKGMTSRHIMFRHALRPSMFSVVTVFGINTGALIGGSLVVERIFGIPGMGSEIVTAVIRDDFPVVLGAVVVIAIGFVIVNFLVDLLYTWLDPRVRAT